MLKLYEVLTRPEVAAFRAALAAPDAGWIDGAVTAGQQARIVKKNRQLPEQSPLNQRLGQAILQALARHAPFFAAALPLRSEEHTSELQSIMRISYAVFCLKKKKYTQVLT